MMIVLGLGATVLVALTQVQGNVLRAQVGSDRGLAASAEPPRGAEIVSGRGGSKGRARRHAAGVVRPTASPRRSASRDRRYRSPSMFSAARSPPPSPRPAPGAVDLAVDELHLRVFARRHRRRAAAHPQFVTVKAAPEAEAPLERAVAQALPNVSVVRVA